MTRIHKQESMLVESRFMWASIAVLVIVSGLMIRLWYLQIYRGDYYREVSERNRLRRIEVPAPRGIIFDRNGEVVLGNRPFYDLVYLKQYVTDKDTTFKVISRLLHVPVTRFEARLEMAQGQPAFLPIPLKRDLSEHEVSIIEANKIFLPGIEVRVAPRRDYAPDVPPHLLGYLKEIDPEALETLNKGSPKNPYLLGDLVGKQGIESNWERYLRGERGYSFIQVDVFGRQNQEGNEAALALPSVPAKPGADLELTIDYELQKTAKAAFAGKNGAVVVLNPQTGEVLAAVSEPGFDPKMMQQGVSPEDWRELATNPLTPMIDKTSGGEFSPGSVYKSVVAIAGLEEHVIDENRTFYCPGFYTLGDRRFYCHDRKGHGTVNLQKALMKSCDVYFYQVGIELGVDRLARYAKMFGLGAKLGVALNMERPGLIPTAAWKMLTFRLPWAGGDTPNIAIGQGYDLMTPLQMASLYATIANGGKVWKPYYVNKVTNHVGETIYEHHPELIKEISEVSPKTFALVRAALETVVMDPGGTGKKAAVEGVTVAGKSGSVQVVGLSKNKNKGPSNVSQNWREHAMFTAFSPTENAEIAVAVVSQNDIVGGGGKSAAPVAGAIIARYWELKRQRAATAQAHSQEEKEKDKNGTKEKAL